MLCSVLFLAVLAQNDRVVTTLRADGDSPRLFVSQARNALSPAFIDPLHEWEYIYFAEGISGTALSTLTPRVRFKMYAQSAKSRSILVPAARTFVRIWDETATRLNIDHPTRYGLMVHVFISDGGKAGGEQIVIKSRSPRDSFATYNAIYLY